MIIHDTTSIVIKKNDKVLLMKRGKRPEKGYWAVPGGHFDKGETPLQCAQREVIEEVGNVKLTSKRPVYIFVHDIDIGHRHKAHVFLGKVIGKLRASTDAKAIGWFTLNQMKSMNITHYTKKIINKLYSKGIKRLNKE